MSTVIGTLVREPLLQFLALGLLLFVGYRSMDRPAAPQPGRIELSEDDVRQLGFTWMAQGRPAPTAHEMQALVDARVREEILYREALALGLDENDTIVRRRMAQKMDFLVEDVASLREPTAEELRTWFQTNAETLTRPSRVTFRHLYFSPDRRGVTARDDAAHALAALAGKGMDAVTALADPFMFQAYYGDRTSEDVRKVFGPEFAHALGALEPGAWGGPIESGYGWHLVWIDAVTPARVPSFEEVEQEVRTTWLEEQRAGMRKAAYAAMRARYEVVLPKDVGGTDLARLRSAADPSAVATSARHAVGAGTPR